MNDDATNGRGFNWQIWAALVLSFIGLNSFPLLFVKWPLTRDVPWANVLIFGLAGWALVVGLRRAFEPGRFHSARMIAGGGIAVFSAVMLTLFVLGRFVWATALPESPDAPKVGDMAPEFTLPDEHRQMRSLASLLTTSTAAGPDARPSKGVLLIFYMYSGCRACNSELHGVQQNLDALAAAGVRPVAISVDPPELSRQLSAEAGYSFTFLSDTKLDVIRRFGVADGDDGARPAEFLIDADGVVRWRNLTGNVFVRATPSQMLDATRLLP